MMKQLVKNCLKNIPPFKQFLARMKNLESCIATQQIRIQQENLFLKKIIEEQRKELEMFGKRVDLLEQQLEKQSRKSLDLEKLISSLEQKSRECIVVKNKITDYEKQIKRLDSRIDSSNNHMNYLYYKGLHPDCYEVALKDWYYQRTWEYLDLENPQTFNEKIQWLKLFDNTPLKTRLADKYLVREWVSGKIGNKYLIPLLGVWDKFDEIDFNLLPKQFVLKTNHGSGWNLIVKNKNDMNYIQTKSKFDLWMKKNFAFFGLELHYMNIPHKIIAEKYMENMDGDIFDYRFFCFNGRPKYVWVDIGSGTSDHKRNVYDLQWNLQEYGVSYPQIVPEPEKPEKFEEMVSLAQKLCADFAFVRVDFYCVENKIYFGEMTFTPQSGTGKWDDQGQNYYYGKLIELPEKKPIPDRKY